MALSVWGLVRVGSLVKKTGKVAAILLAVLLMLGAGVAYYLTTNIHAVIPGQVFRSAQLSPSRLRHLVKDKGIRSELNLRGQNPQSDWYRDEIHASKQLGLKHYNVALSKMMQPSREQLITLIHIIQDSPKPLLLHCASGSDRSAFVAAMVLILQGAPLKKARKQISWLYFSATSGTIGPIVLNRYAKWLRSKQMKSSAAHFIAWANNNY